jgi:hypothetical protein
MKNLVLGVIFSAIIGFAPTVKATVLSEKTVASKNLPDDDKKKKKKSCEGKKEDCKKGEKKSCCPSQKKSCEGMKKEEMKEEAK